MLGIAALTTLIAWFDPQLGMTLGAILLLVLLVWPTLFYRLGKKNGQHLTQNKAELRVRTLDWLQGYSELTIFGAEQTYRQAILTAQDKLLRNQYVNAQVSGLAQSLLLIWLAADGVGGQTPDPLIALVAFATMASVELLMPIAGAFQHLGQTLTSARRLNEIILAKPEVEFTAQPTAHNGQYNIEFNGVHFAYQANKPKAIDDFTLTLAQGQKVAIVGQTGSGKSTLIQLLCRYWDVQQGQITIGGTDIREWRESDLRAAISVVSQRVDILNGTLRDNLKLAKPDATDEALSDILQQVGLENYKMPRSILGLAKVAVSYPVEKNVGSALREPYCITLQSYCLMNRPKGWTSKPSSRSCNCCIVISVTKPCCLSLIVWSTLNRWMRLR